MTALSSDTKPPECQANMLQLDQTERHHLTFIWKNSGSIVRGFNLIMCNILKYITVDSFTILSGLAIIIVLTCNILCQNIYSCYRANTLKQISLKEQEAAPQGSSVLGPEGR